MTFVVVCPDRIPIAFRISDEKQMYKIGLFALFKIAKQLYKAMATIGDMRFFVKITGSIQ